MCNPRILRNINVMWVAELTDVKLASSLWALAIPDKDESKITAEIGFLVHGTLNSHKGT